MHRRFTLLLGALFGCTTAPAPPVDNGASASALRDLPEELTRGRGVEVLEEEARFAFDDAGKKTYTYRIRYRILDESGIEGWSAISAEWSPWYQEPPELTAVVEGRDGRRQSLDRKSIAELPVGSEHSDLYTDRRRLRAPLPALEVGATVTQQIVQRDTRPFFDRGTVGVFFFGMRVPVMVSTLILEVPAKSALRWESRGIDIQPEDKKENGRRKITFVVGPLPPIRPADRLLPADVARFPHLVFSTARSWKDVAVRYHELVEDRIGGSDVRELVAGIPPMLPRATLVSALLARLHERVRYTGIEFGQEAIIPWRPAETIRRKFGDCKDKAALLVSMLRHFQVPAYLALLRAGTNEDVSPSLPGLEGFNHAIVYIPGQEPLWIDATAEYAPVGLVPPNVEGRFALVASADTADLIRIPESKSDDNRYLESREYYLADVGPMRIIERTNATGSMQLRLREQFGATDRRTVRDSLESYVRNAYHAKDLARFELGDARDVSIPFSIEVEAYEANVGYTASSDAFVQLRNGILFSFLPELVRYAALAGPNETEVERIVARDLVERRSEDLVFPEPYYAEVRFKVVPPTGYTLRTLPDPKRYQLGPGEYVSSFKKRADDVVEATFIFSTGKRRLTADEVRAFVEGLREAWDQPIVALEFDHRGSRHMAEGRFREGLTEYRTLVELHEKSALHHARMAEALLRAGLGEPSREEAKRAVGLDPSSAYAYFTLGVVLSHDLFGRLHQPGFDRAGATKAFEHVKELEPDNIDARLKLAVLLEHDALGNRYADAEGLVQAIAEYQAIRATQKDKVDDNLLVALYWSKKFDEIISLGGEMAPSPIRDAMVLVAHAATKSVPAALSELDRAGLSPEARQGVIDAAVTYLAHLRFYPQARALGEIAARGADDMVSSQGRLAMLRRLEGYDGKAIPPTDPSSVVQSALDILFSDQTDDHALDRLLSKETLGKNANEALEGMTTAFNQFKRAIRGTGVSLEMVRDNVLAGTQYSQEGDDKIGYRVRAVLIGPNGQKSSLWFVVKEHGQYRLRGSESSPHVLAEEALRLAEKGDWAGARRWLDWAKEIVGYQSDLDPLTTHPFSALWHGMIPEPKSEEEQRALIEIAASSLVVDGPNRDRAVKKLENARKVARSPGIELRIDQALARAYTGQSNWERALEVARRLRKRNKDSDGAYEIEFRSLYRLGRNTEARTLAEKRLASKPNDSAALSQLADVEIADKNYVRAEKRLRELIGLGLASSSTYNNLAWLTLFLPELPSDSADLALEANNMTRFTDPTALHTLAAIYAEQGKTREAFQLVLKRMDLRNADEPEGVDWYLLGRIMEHYDLEEMAKVAYRKVPKGEEREADSTYELAHRRLSRWPN
jgi:tetratricopeptide (TPR) repeat protein